MFIQFLLLLFGQAEGDCIRQCVFVKTIGNTKTVAVGSLLMFTPKSGLALLLLFSTLLGATKATAQPIDGNICPGESQIYRMARSRHFFLYICSQDERPTYYVGNATNGSSSITLPLASVESEVYIARNKNHSYILDFDQERLTVVMPGGKQITQSIEQLYD